MVGTANERPHSRPLRVLEWSTLKIVFSEVQVFSGAPGHAQVRTEKRGGKLGHRALML